MFIKEIRAFIKRSILMCLLAGALVILANHIIQGHHFQKKVLKRISASIGYDIQARDIELNLWNGLGIYINDLSARSRSGHEKFTASGLRLTLDVKALLAGRILPSTLYLSRPVIEMPWEKGYEINHALERFLPEKMPLFWFPGIQSLVIEQGRVVFPGASINIEDFDLRAGRISSSPLVFFIMSKGNIGFRGETAGFELSGRVTPPSNDSGPMLVKLKLQTENAPLGWIRWPASIQVKNGHFNTMLDIEGDPTDHLAMKGLIDLNGFKFDYVRKDRLKEFSIPKIALDFKSTVMADHIDVQPLKIRGDDIAIDMGLTFGFQKSGAPLLDMNFKSEVMDAGTFKALFPSPLLPLWLEDRFFPIIAGGDIKIVSFSLKGGIDQIRHISRPENRSVMEMLFECRGLEVSGGGTAIPFRDVSADVELKDGLFRIKGLSAGFGSSLIKNAGIDIRDVFSISRFYEINAEGDFDIRELMGQRGMDVVPLNVSRFLDRQPDISGRVSGNILIGYRKEWGHPEILNGDLFMKDVSLDKKEYIFPVRFDEAVIHIDNAGSDNMSGSGSWGNNSFSVSADFGIAGVTPSFKNARLSAKVDMNQVFSCFKPEGNLPLVFNESLPWDIYIAKEDAGWSVKGSAGLMDAYVKYGALNLMPSADYRKDLAFELAVRPDEGRIDVNKALLRLKDSSVNMAGSFDLERKRPVQVRIYSSGLLMKDLSLISDQREIFSGGILRGDLNISMPETKGDSLLLEGLVEGADLSFQTGGNSPFISDCAFQADFSEGGAKINYCTVKTGRSSFAITGVVSGRSDLEGDIKVHSEYLDFSDIISTEDGPSRNNLMDHVKLSISMDVSRGRFRKLEYGPAGADLVFDRGNLFIKDSQVRLDHGALAIKGHVLRSPDREIEFDCDMSIKDQPVDELIEGLGIDYRALKGDIAIDGSFSIKGNEEKEMLSGLKGSAKVSITEGLIKNPNIIIKVLDFLSLQKIFDQRPPDLRGDGLYFESISADAVVEDGTLKSDNFVMRSPVLNAVANGKIDIPQRRFDFTLFTQPYGTIDSLVSIVPILGYILTGKNKSVMAYPFDVKGSFSDPEVRYVPFETMEGGVPGILKRILLTPIRLLDKIGRTLRNNGDAKGK